MKVILKKKYTAKQAIVASITAGIALVNLLALLLALVSAHRRLFVGGVEHTFVNGFTMAFGECPIMIDDVSGWLPLYCRAHFVIALTFIFFLGLSFVLKKQPCFGKLGGFSDLIALITTLIYMIGGVAANSVASGFVTNYFSSYTLAYIPFIVVCVAIVALIIVKLFMPDDFSFGKKKRNIKR